MTAHEQMELVVKHLRRASDLTMNASLLMPTTRLRSHLAGVSVRIDQERRKMTKWAAEVGERKL